MTLLVLTLRRDPATGTLIEDPAHHAHPGAELGGFEAWRKSVWGSDALRARGAVFLPRLADADLHVEASDLPAFRAECAALLAQVEELATELGVAADSLASRLRNFLAAAERADPVHGCVYVG